jgi:hypothetical protein
MTAVAFSDNNTFHSTTAWRSRHRETRILHQGSFFSLERFALAEPFLRPLSHPKKVLFDDNAKWRCCFCIFHRLPAKNVNIAQRETWKSRKVEEKRKTTVKRMFLSRREVRVSAWHNCQRLFIVVG